jgi:hypothetical protein
VLLSAVSAAASGGKEWQLFHSCLLLLIAKVMIYHKHLPEAAYTLKGVAQTNVSWFLVCQKHNRTEEQRIVHGIEKDLNTGVKFVLVVCEMAVKLSFVVYFKVVCKKGPPHITFTMICTP